MHQREESVDFDREPAVRGGREDALAGDAAQLGDEARLALPAADVLEHGARVGIVEGAVPEGQRESVGADEPHAGERGLQKRGVVESDGGDPAFVRIPGLEVVGIFIGAIAGDADIEDGVGFRRFQLEKSSVFWVKANCFNSP